MILKTLFHLSIGTGEKQKTFTYEGVSKDYRLPAMFKGWDIFVAKYPMLSADHPLFFTSPWTASCNIIMLDHVRTFSYSVCLSETTLINRRSLCLLLLCIETSCS
jgi:hypothetical protein